MLRDQVRQILTELADAPERDDTPLKLDSLTLVQLVEALEDACAIRIGAREVTPESFASIDAIVRFLETKT
jgi:acyl carrier protein